MPARCKSKILTSTTTSSKTILPAQTVSKLIHSRGQWMVPTKSWAMVKRMASAQAFSVDQNSLHWNLSPSMSEGAIRPSIFLQTKWTIIQRHRSHRPPSTWVGWQNKSSRFRPIRLKTATARTRPSGITPRQREERTRWVSSATRDPRHQTARADSATSSSLSIAARQASRATTIRMDRRIRARLPTQATRRTSASITSRRWPTSTRATISPSAAHSSGHRRTYHSSHSTTVANQLEAPSLKESSRRGSTVFSHLPRMQARIRTTQRPTWVDRCGSRWPVALRRAQALSIKCLVHLASNQMATTILPVATASHRRHRRTTTETSLRSTPPAAPSILQLKSTSKGLNIK